MAINLKSSSRHSVAAAEHKTIKSHQILFDTAFRHNKLIVTEAKEEKN